MYGLDIDFDYKTSKEYRFKYESQCDCAYCRNYYKAFKTKYPESSKLIEFFGLSVDFPLEIMPLDFDKINKEMGYISYYPVKGKLDEDGLILNIEELEIKFLKGSYLNNPCPNPKMEDPYFLIEISGIKLNWVLDEEID